MTRGTGSGLSGERGQAMNGENEPSEIPPSMWVKPALPRKAAAKADSEIPKYPTGEVMKCAQAYDGVMSRLNNRDDLALFRGPYPFRIMFFACCLRI